MKPFILKMGCLALLVAMFIAGPLAAEPVDVFFMWGASNFDGFSTLVDELEPPWNSPQPDVLQWQFNGTGPGFWDELRPELLGNEDRFGVELSTGRVLADASDTQVAIWRYRRGGILEDELNPDGGVRFEEFVENTRISLLALETDGFEPTVRGFFSEFGERDAVNLSGVDGDNFESNLRQWIGALRTEFDAPELPVVLRRSIYIRVQAGSDIELIVPGVQSAQ